METPTKKTNKPVLTGRLYCINCKILNPGRKTTTICKDCGERLIYAPTQEQIDSTQNMRGVPL